MKKIKFKKSDWILLLIIAATFVVGLIVYPKLPNQMPMHWNIKGQVDSYGNKFTGTFLFPLINLAIFFLFIFLPKIDPRKENYEKFSNIYLFFRWLFVLFFSAMYLFTIYYSIKGAGNIPSYLDVSFVVPFLVSLLYIFLGNYMGKIKDNFFVGIRTPWTLSSKEVWYKTHRLAGKLYVLSGILGLIGAFFGGTISFIMLIGPIMLASVTSIIYSYLTYQKEISHKK